MLVKAIEKEGKNLLSGAVNNVVVISLTKMVHHQIIKRSYKFCAL